MGRFICVFGMLLAVNTWAANAVETLTQLLDVNRNIEGEFQQSTYNEQGEKVQQSEGVFVLAAPNRFVWDTVTPFPQRIISDGEWVTIWDVDLEQATRKPFAGSVGNSPAALLGDSAEHVLSHYRVESSSEQRYTLSPQDQEDLFDSLELTFDGTGIRTMRIKDVLGQTTVIEFSHIQAHQGVSDQYFTVDLPASVDVITEP